MFKVFLTDKSDRELSRLTTSERDRVLDKLRKLDFPFPANLDIRKLAMQDFYRLRVGKVRVIFEMDRKRKQIWIRKVAYRKDIYR